MRIIGTENINESLSTHYLIYKITNTINNKHYIGQHKTTNCFDGYCGSGTYLQSAKYLYGLSAFTKEILFDFDNFDDMNNKEIELVQLSNCFPYDQMSYNLIPGGDGWNLTPDICKQRGETYSKNYWNKSEEERNEYKNECQRRAIEREKNKTNEEREQAKINQHRTWENKTDEEIQKGVDKWRKSIENRTVEQQNKITEKRLATLNARTDEQKEATKEKLKNTIASRTKEQQEQINKKHSVGLKKHYTEHPEQAKEHSIRMTGKGNPAYGRKWMNNGIERVYVKASDIQTYLDNGYIIGWIKVKK